MVVCVETHNQCLYSGGGGRLVSEDFLRMGFGGGTIFGRGVIIGILLKQTVSLYLFFYQKPRLFCRLRYPANHSLSRLTRPFCARYSA